MHDCVSKCVIACLSDILLVLFSSSRQMILYWVDLSGYLVFCLSSKERRARVLRYKVSKNQVEKDGERFPLR